MLGLLRADSADEYLATQTWPSGAYRERVCSGDRYAEWFEEYLPILARFDELAEFVDDWDSTDEPERECAEEGTDLL